MFWKEKERKVYVREREKGICEGKREKLSGVCFEGGKESKIVL